ncbi:sex peptide receptor-like [Mizuhopecten yessoensis]|uniref:FMRFamide receptor n=1 Tax=Mizuhopecten yessoensis TaxID=6573 RepID=A0A210PQ49_MIZYE|nr:sex peptide receptor-like [Mizuhopecten yessoensis]OWF38625.1 FMRFamide receptor [Mizuhopecten yessoensis]
MAVNLSLEFRSQNNISDESTNVTAMTDDNSYLIIINGYVVPALAIVVLLTNAVVIAVLRRQQTYGASQAGLVGIAVSDTLTLVLPAPFYFYSYGLGNYAIQFGWCQAMDWIALYLPTISHTASIWLTVYLTLQRYFYVCLPFKARGWCTLRYTIICIVLIYLMAVVVHMCRFFVFEYHNNVYFDPWTNTTEEYCKREYRIWVDVSMYYSSYLGIRIIFIQFVPCVSLIILNCKILHGLQTVTNKRLQLNTNAQSNHATVKENIRVTVMIICMAVITLLVEFPVGIIQLLYVFPFMFGYDIIEMNTLKYVEVIANLVIIFSYPLNFLLYCSMSAEFKATLRQLCWSNACREGSPRSYSRCSKNIPPPSITMDEGVTISTKV